MVLAQMIWLLLAPILAAVVVLVAPRRAAYGLSVAAAAGLLAQVYQLTVGAREVYPWIPALGAQVALYNDGLSYLLVALTGLITLIAVAATPGQGRRFYAMLLLLAAGSYGVFLAADLLLFFVCFEAVLAPMYFLIAVYGAEERRRAAFQFLVYTAAGSIALLLGIVTLYVAAGTNSFAMEELLRAELSPVTGRWVFWAFVVGLAVKTPMFPVHTWLPDAHTQAPTAGSLVLASVMLKMGTYGLARLALPLLPAGGQDALLLGSLSVAAILYGGWICLAQTDWKRLIAYSSVSHLGFCTLGIFSLNATGLAGGLLQQVNHGISTGLLFLLAGFAYERRHTRVMSEYGGIAKVMPGYAALLLFAMLGSMGLPLLNGFVGEFTILRGAYEARLWWAALAVVGIVLGAAYLLRLYRYTMLGPITRPENERLQDLTWREWLLAAPLVGWSVWIGLRPREHFALLEGPVAAILERVKP